MRRRRGHGARDTLLVLVLGAFAVVAALAWLAEHLIVFAGVALIAGGAFHLGQRRRARPGQVMPRQARPEAPAAAGTVPAATLPLAGDRERWSQCTRQPASLQAGPDQGFVARRPAIRCPAILGALMERKDAEPGYRVTDDEVMQASFGQEQKP